MKQRTMNSNMNSSTQSKFGAAALAIAFLATMHEAWANNQLWIAGTAATNMTDMNWSDNNNWNGYGSGGAGPDGNSVYFGNAGTSGTLYTVNNMVDQNGLNPYTLTYSNSTSTYFTTQIPAGVSMSVANSSGLSIGGGSVPSGATCAVAILGSGGFTVDGNISLNGVAASSTIQMVLDMSMLSYFTNNASAATWSIGTSAENSANISLASNSFVNVATINLETTGGSNGRTGNIYLGATTNAIWANNINVSTGKGGTSTILFTNSAGTVAIAGTGGTARSTMILGDATSGTANCAGSLVLTGHLANVLAGTLTLGESSSGDSGTGTTSGSVDFDDGTFDVTSIVMGNCASTGSGAIAAGSFTAGSGSTLYSCTLVVNSPSGPGGGSVILGDTTTSKTGTGTLTIGPNCTAQIYCNITNAIAAQNTGKVNLYGGTLIMEAAADTIGNSTVPITTFSLSNATVVLSTSATSTTPNVYAASVPAQGTTTVVVTNISGTVSGSTIIPLISYSGSSPASGLTVAVNSSYIPLAYIPALYDTGSKIELEFTQVGPLPPLVIWAGATNGNWDYITTNWVFSGAPTNYSDGDYVQFDDTLLSNSIITLTATLNPAGTTVTNNNETYSFIGSGCVTNGTLSKQGTATLIIDNSEANSFTSTTIGGGILQIGNSDTNGSLGSGSVNDNGTLDINRSDTALNLSGTISGTGSVVDNGAGGSLVTLSANNNSFSGGLFLDSGTLVAALGGSISVSSGSISFNGGTLEYGVSGMVTNTTDYSSRFSTVAGQQYNIDIPTNNLSPAYGTVSITFASPLTSSGGVLTKTGGGELIFTATNTFNGGILLSDGMVRASNTNGFGTNQITETGPGTEIYFASAGTYSNNLSIQGYGALEGDGVTALGAVRIASSGVDLAGTITLSGNTSISPRSSNPGTISGQITDNGNGYGIQFGNTSTTTSAGSGMLIISSTANSWGGNTTISDGFLKLGASGVIPTGSGAGNVVMTNAGTSFNAGITNSFFDLNGYNQTINGLLNAPGLTGTTLNMLWVTNDGASPATLTLGNNNASGNFGGIIGNGANALSLAKIGTGTQTLSGANSYTGNTTISAGTLALTGSGSIANSSDIIVAGGATFDISRLSSPFTLGPGQTLSNSTVGAIINGANSTGSGALSLVYDSVHPSFIVTSAGMTLSGGTGLTINNTGAALGAGTYSVIANASGGSVGGMVPSTYMLTGNGIAAGMTNSLVISISGQPDGNAEPSRPGADRPHPQDLRQRAQRAHYARGREPCAGTHQRAGDGRERRALK